MIHQYQLNGYNIVLDVNSGAIHVVDGLTYDMIAEYKEREKDELIADMAAKHGVSKEEAAEAYGEIGELEASGELFFRGRLRALYRQLQETAHGGQGAVSAHRPRLQPGLSLLLLPGRGNTTASGR